MTRTPGEQRTHDAFWAKIRAAQAERKATGKVSLFPPVGDSPLDAYGRQPHVEITVLRASGPEETLYEHRSMTDHRPRLDVSNVSIAFDWLRENAGEVTLPGIFRRDGRLIRCPRIGEKGYIPLPEGTGDDGPAQVRVLNAEDMSGIVQSRFWCYREKVNEDRTTGNKKITRQPAMIPTAVCTRLQQGVDEWNGLPQVTAVTHTPILRRDGSILGQPGYDEAQSTLYLPEPGFVPHEMPREVDDRWLSGAVRVLKYLIEDFPFETDGHRANYLGLLLTPLLRLVLPPPYPMFLLNAHQRGTGKSLLAQVASIIHGGVHRPMLPIDDDEIRKQITTVLTTTTAPIVNWDNVMGRIASGNLANLLTSGVWGDRLLGRNDVELKSRNDRVWIATGNNIRLGGDMARRCYWVSIDAETPKPELRNQFNEPDLLGYVRSNRGMLVTALLTVARAWAQAGMPMELKRSDSYGRWDAGVRGILEVSGLWGDKFGAGESVVMEQSEDELELGVLIEGIWLMWKGQPWTVTDLKRMSSELAWATHVDSILPADCKEKRDPWKSLGRYLARHERQYAEDKRLVRVGAGRGAVRWGIEHTPIVTAT